MVAELSHVAVHHTGGHDAIHNLLSQYLCRYDPAADRDQAAAQPWIETIGVSIGADEEFSGNNLSALCLDAHATGVVGGTQDRGVLVNDGICRVCEAYDTGKQLCGMQAANVTAHQTSNIEVRADVLSNVRSFDLKCLDVKVAVKEVGVTAKLFGLIGRHRSVEQTRQEEIAFDILFLKEMPEILPRSLPFHEDAICPVLTEALDQLLASRSDATARHTTVSAGCCLTQSLTIKELDMLTFPRQFDCRGQACISTPDDGHVTSLVDIPNRQRRKDAVVRPVGR
jgi:hypothetical protein